jgi:hypothetical protein
MQQLVLPAPLDSLDFLVTQSSRGRVGELSQYGGMECLRSRYGLAFHCNSKALHRLFNFG